MAIGKFFAALGCGAFAFTVLVPAQTGTPVEELARNLTQQLAARQFDAVVGHFDGTMAGAMPSAKLSQTWDAITGQAGAFQSITGTSVQAVQGYQVVLVTTHFEKANLGIKWAFDGQSRVAGLFVVPAEAPNPWTAPDYAQPAKFQESPVTVGAAPWQLDGTLTVPVGAGPFPAVVLVAGSGPEDQDETIVGNKPFKDIAWGLASRGIAVLRFNKRTLQYGKELKAHQAGFTVNEESVDDARAAVALLATHADIDPQRIFVLGHSLGAMLAPRIAQGDKQVAGLIIMAGPTRPFEQVLVE
ncbi:MAG: alpha/beta fold hydrolase, partial [Acidobacteriaceae bacterium]